MAATTKTVRGSVSSWHGGVAAASAAAAAWLYLYWTEPLWRVLMTPCCLHHSTYSSESTVHQLHAPSPVFLRGKLLLTLVCDFIKYKRKTQRNFLKCRKQWCWCTVLVLVHIILITTHWYFLLVICLLLTKNEVIVEPLLASTSWKTHTSTKKTGVRINSGVIIMIRCHPWLRDD